MKLQLAVMLKSTDVVEVNIQLLTFVAVLINLCLMNKYLVNKLYDYFGSKRFKVCILFCNSNESVNVLFICFTI